MPDLRFAGLLNFSSTQVTVEALTDAGRAFLGDAVGRCAGVAPESATLRKSGAAAMFDAAQAAGLRPEAA
jgi:hypothetical protein